VGDLDAMLGQLRGEGLDVEGPQEEPYGRFAWLTDPDGNRIELYQEVEPQA
jgi:catechol-2,3-dioxygenase